MDGEGTLPAVEEEGKKNVLIGVEGVGGIVVSLVSYTALGFFGLDAAGKALPNVDVLGLKTLDEGVAHPELGTVDHGQDEGWRVSDEPVLGKVCGIQGAGGFGSEGERHKKVAVGGHLKVEVAAGGVGGGDGSVGVELPNLGLENERAHGRGDVGLTPWGGHAAFVFRKLDEHGVFHTGVIVVELASDKDGLMLLRHPGACCS